MIAAQVRERVSELLAEYSIPSTAIGVLHEGEITDFAIGVKNLTTREPATTDTIYQCGSLSKTWTAVAFMQLVDEGKVGLDEPVRTYLPGFRVADPEVSAKVTPRHLLYHTNGIEEDFGNPGEGEDVYERMVGNIGGAIQVQPLGYTHGYSAALGYAILARIMEVVDGKRWGATMKARLFDPLGLRGTSSWYADVDRSRAATGHIRRTLEEGTIVSPMQGLPRGYGPGGNISSTAAEVLTMASIFLNGGVALNGARILSAEAVHEMTHSRVPVPDPYMFGPYWALGLVVCDWHGQTVYAHDGSTVGQHARLRIVPDSNLAVAMLANGGPRDSLYRQVYNEILADLGAVSIPDLPSPDPALKLDPSKYEGVYERAGVRFEVASEGAELYFTNVLNPMHAKMLGKPDRIRYRLLPVSETHFLMPPVDSLEDTQTVAIYDFQDGEAQYVHTNCRVVPRTQG
jgi:CubicO group peptidase (beta-lactamase class C family)